MSGKRIPDDVRQQILAAYRDGELIEDIAANYGTHRNTIRRFVRQAGGPTRPPGGIRRPKVAEREDIAYRGGWVRDGLVMRPVKAGVNA